jgi:two-component system, LytTR family, sensor kinase
MDIKEILTFGGRRSVRRVFFHLIIWGVLVIFPLYLMYLLNGHDQAFFNTTLLHIFLYAAIFYLNYLVFSHWFFRKRMRILYVAGVLVMVMFCSFVFDQMMHRTMHPQDHHHHGMKIELRKLPPEPPPGGMIQKRKPPKSVGVFNFTFTAIFISLLGLGLTYIQRVNRDEKRRKDAENERIQSELTYLKNQISPHFFFNTLNSIYALTESRPDDARETIIMLSKMMRYLLYDTEQPFVLLTEEISFLENYIRLMKLRISDKVAITNEFPVRSEGISVPPLLFLPFIENAFKHGVSNRKPSFIDIRIELEGDILTFSCRNSEHESGIDDSIQTSGHGIGLINVNRRLSLLMPDHYSLEIHSGDGIYGVNLMLNLSGIAKS